MRGVVAGWLLVVLAGCATVPPPKPAEPPQTAWLRHERRLSALDTWTLSGRLAITRDNEAWNVSVYWSQRPDGYEVSVVAPLGGGGAQLRGSADGVVLQTSDDGLYLAQDPDVLMEEVLGLQVPITGLRYWVLGIPQPGVTQEHRLDDWGRLTTLSQADWQVEFLRYRDTPSGSLPDKLFMHNAHFEVRLVISDWEFPAGPVAAQ